MTLRKPSSILIVIHVGGRPSATAYRYSTWIPRLFNYAPHCFKLIPPGEEFLRT
jgi:hypothetical protein